jgi:hypothetical protein
VLRNGKRKIDPPDLSPPKEWFQQYQSPNSAGFRSPEGVPEGIVAATRRRVPPPVISSNRKMVDHPPLTAAPPDLTPLQPFGPLALRPRSNLHPRSFASGMKTRRGRRLGGGGGWSGASDPWGWHLCKTESCPDGIRGPKPTHSPAGGKNGSACQRIHPEGRGHLHLLPFPKPIVAPRTGCIDRRAEAHRGKS